MDHNRTLGVGFRSGPYLMLGSDRGISDLSSEVQCNVFVIQPRKINWLNQCPIYKIP
jgi:hypothetical protein